MVLILNRRSESEALRAELALARLERDELTRLRQTHASLVQQLPSESTLAKLREEQAAIRRLRAELESLKTPRP